MSVVENNADRALQSPQKRKNSDSCQQSPKKSKNVDCSPQSPRKRRNSDSSPQSRSLENILQSPQKRKKPAKSIDDNRITSTNENMNVSSILQQRLRKRKKPKKENIGSMELIVPQLSVVNSESSTKHFSINDNVEAVPARMKKRKKLHMESLEDVDQCSEAISGPSKKVSFNDTIDSRSIKKKLKKFQTKNNSDQPPLKSILKPPPKSTTARQDRAFIYLETWKRDKTNWKFEKVVQTWLLKNMFNISLLPDEKFTLLVEYMADMRGAAVTLAKRLSENIIKNMKSKSQTSINDELLDLSCRRARIVLECLQ